MIVVTGATGFVGRYLIDHLATHGIEVVAAGRTSKYAEFFRSRGVPFVAIDVADAKSFDALPTTGVDAIIHLAAIIPAAVQDTRTDIFLRTNTLGTFNALEYARRNGIGKFLYTTTLYEGMELPALPITEAMGRKYSLVGDHASYVVSKVAAAEYVDHYAQEYGMQGIVFRLTGLLGYGRQEGFWANGVFNASAFEVFYRRAKAGQTLEIWGAHVAKRDSLYVKDAVRAMALAVTSDRAHGLYLIGSGEGRTNEDEVKAFAEVFSTAERPVRIVYRPDLPEKPRSYYFDISKAKSDFGWKPAFTFAEVLADYDREVQSGRFGG
jgi:UDP-glucose 4-epimerase